VGWRRWYLCTAEPGAGTAFAQEDGEGMSEGDSRAKAVLSLGPNSGQGREEVGVTPALLARPVGLENVSVPREQPFELLPFVPLSGEPWLTPPPSWSQPRTFTCEEGRAPG